MASGAFVPFFLSYFHTHRRSSASARVFSDTPSPSQAFEANLANRLHKLTHGDISSSDLISFNWMCEALDVVLSTQASVKHSLRTKATSTTPACSDKEMKMMQQYMEDSVKMLDACCLLKETLAGADAYVKASQLALKRLQGVKVVHEGDIQRAKHALLSAKQEQERILQLDEPGTFVRTNVHSMKRLSACSSMLRKMGDKLTAPTASDYINIEEVTTASMAPASASCSYSALPVALYGWEMSTLFFLRLLSTALSCPAASGPRRSSSLMTPLHISRNAAAWAPSLLSLQAQVNTELLKVAQAGRTQRCITLLPELHTLDASLNQIYESLLQGFSSEKAREDMRQLVEAASMLIEDMEDSIDRLQHQMDCISSSLVDIRMTLLDSF